MFVREIGDGIELRLLQESDAGELFAAIDRNRERLRRWFPWVDKTLSAEDSLRFLEGSRTQFEARDAMHLGIFAGGRLAGGMGCTQVDWTHRNTSVGYWLDAAAEGKGIVTRCCAVLLDFLFGEWKLHRVEIRCNVANVRSAAVARRLGFRREGLLREAWLTDGYQDLLVWGMLEGEWPAVRPPWQLERASPSPARNAPAAE